MNKIKRYTLKGIFNKLVEDDNGWLYPYYDYYRLLQEYNKLKESKIELIDNNYQLRISRKRYSIIAFVLFITNIALLWLRN